MKVFEALYRIGHMVDAGIKGTFTLVISDNKEKKTFVIDTEKLTFSATDNKYDWTKTGDEAGYALSIALMSGYEVVELAWKGTDRITGLASYMKFDEAANEWHDL